MKGKKRWDSNLNPRNVKFVFLGDIAEKQRSTILASSQKLYPGIKTPQKDEFINLGSPLGPKSQADFLEKKTNELKKVNGIVEKLDAHYGVFNVEKSFHSAKVIVSPECVLPKCFIYPALLEKYDKTVRDGLSKVCNLNFDDISSTQLALAAEMGGLGISSASLLALPGFLASAFGASDFLTTIFLETLEDVSFTKALENSLNLTNEQESPLVRTRKNWTQHVYVKTAEALISRRDDKRSKVFNAHQGKIGSQWLNVVPCKNVMLSRSLLHQEFWSFFMSCYSQFSLKADVGFCVDCTELMAANAQTVLP